MSKPTVRRTYGRTTTRTSSSSCLASSPPPSLSSPSIGYRYTQSSSPFPLCTPEHEHISEEGGIPLLTPPSSPLFPNDNDDDDNQKPFINGEEKSQSMSIRTLSAAPVITAPSHVQSSLKGFFTPIPMSKKRKRPLEPSTTVLTNSSSSCAISTSSSASASASSSSLSQQAEACCTSKTSKLTQLHLTHLPLLQTCQGCKMSYMKGGEDDDLHLKHHIKVIRGIPWDGLGKGKSSDRGWKVVEDNITFGKNTEGRGEGKGGTKSQLAKGRIVMIDGSLTSTKIHEILSMVDLVLSASPLPKSILNQCKIFLFLTSSPPPPPHTSNPKDGSGKKRRLDITNSVKDERERVVSVVVAQGIKWAMRVLDDTTLRSSFGSGSVVETGGLGSVTCDPKPLPTPLGIHRLYTIPSYRNHNLHTLLLDQACKNTVYGCTFSPYKGQVAFSQPTESGRKVMIRWGGGNGNIRVFVDDESQL